MGDTRPSEKVETARRFRALREKTGFTQAKMARLIFISRKAVNYVERARTMPHPDTWARFAMLEWKHMRPEIVLPEHWDD